MICKGENWAKEEEGGSSVGFRRERESLRISLSTASQLHESTRIRIATIVAGWSRHLKVGYEVRSLRRSRAGKLVVPVPFLTRKRVNATSSAAPMSFDQLGGDAGGKYPR